MLSALVAGGHVLLEDVPGNREDDPRARDRRQRRRRRRSRASSARRTCSRPTSPASRSSTRRRRTFVFQPGPLFANVVLVDEINRAMPKTQSALLEAMAEHQVTVDGVDAAAARPVPADRDREPDRVRGDVPAARGAARPLLPARDARLPGRGARSSRSSASSGTATRSTASTPVVSTSTSSRELRRAAEDVYLDDLLESWIVAARPRDARARRGRGRRLGARLARAREDGARLGAPARAATTSSRRTSSSSSSPCSATGSCCARRTSPRRGTCRSAEALRAAPRPCLELVPPPRPDWAVAASAAS